MPGGWEAGRLGGWEDKIRKNGKKPGRLHLLSPREGPAALDALGLPLFSSFLNLGGRCYDSGRYRIHTDDKRLEA
jgi:hypothetical protein